MTAKQRPLGSVQRDFLRSFRDDRPGWGHDGTWTAGGGWIWGTPSETIRLCEALEKRGLLKRIQHPRRAEGLAYGLTDAGNAVLKTIITERKETT